MKIVQVRHPLVQHKIGLLRNASLNTKDFRELVTELGTLLAYEATADLELTAETMPGWAGDVAVQKIAGAKITLVPILRAGLGMLPGVLALIPTARVSVVGLQRDEETLQPVPYFERLTGRLEERDALILDPMLATGGTLIATIDMLKRAGAKRIKGIFLVAAPEGLAALEKVHPDVEVYTAAIDERLLDLFRFAAILPVAIGQIREAFGATSIGTMTLHAISQIQAFAHFIGLLVTSHCLDIHSQVLVEQGLDGGIHFCNFNFVRALLGPTQNALEVT